MFHSPSGGGPERGQSSPIGVVLLLGMTLAAAVTIVVGGSVAIDDAQTNSQIGQAEKALSQLDARTSQVALGDSTSQSVRIGQSGGDYRIDEDAGQVRLVHRNWDGDGSNKTIFEDTMGAIVYERGSTTVAYQGGGVWRSDDGRSTMVSSPEFHYKRATLTFPIIRVVGSGSSSGRHTSASIRHNSTTAIFPAEATYDGTVPYANPIDEGNMTVVIQSEYCHAWQSYLASRTDGEVSECTDDGEVEANLVTLGAQGPFSLIGGNELPVRDQEGLQTFEVVLRHQDSEASKFNNLGWSLSAEEGDRQLELSIQRKGGGGGVEAGDAVKVSLYYSDDGGDTYHGWMNDQDYVAEDTGNGLQVRVDFIDPDVDGNWSELQGSDLESFNPDTQVGSRPVELDETEPMDNVTQYYFDQMGDADFTTHEQNNANLGDGSQGTIEYEGGGEVVTFLHVTDNVVEVRLKS